MNRFKRYLKAELDADIFACVHGMSMIFLYGFELYLYGIKNISFAIIFQMLVIAYLIAWTQKLLFLKDRIYKKIEYKVRVVLWNVLPVLWTFLFGNILGWYRGYPIAAETIFLMVMLCYYIIWWILLQIVYKEDTNELNNKLVMYKQQNIRKEV